MDASTKAKVLDLFRLYLENLPNTLPYIESGGETSKYSFDFFSVDDDDLQDKGLVGAIKPSTRDTSRSPQQWTHNLL